MLGQVMKVTSELNSRGLQHSWIIIADHLLTMNSNVVFAVDLDCPDSQQLLVQVSENKQNIIINTHFI